MALKSKSPKRYHLHSKLKKLNIAYDPYGNVVWMPLGTEEADLPNVVLKLRENHGYSVSFKIE